MTNDGDEVSVQPARTMKPLTSKLGWSTPDRIEVYGHDLPRDIIGTIDLAGMAYLGIQGRMPTASEQRVFNAIMVTLVEHGQTPSTITARLTYAGAPEALQAAVAAGLLGLGTVFVGSMEGAARILQQKLADAPRPFDTDRMAEELVADLKAKRQIIPGLGHQKHKPVDPRAVRLLEVAEEEGLYGPHCQLMSAVAVVAQRESKKSLPLNATGAIGAIASDMGIRWEIVRGLGVIARSVGIVVHLLEDMETPLGIEIWNRVDDEVTNSQLQR
jgi:citrate synthase